ncbi:hypothetical protein BXA50_14560, partial [Enterococcus faecium]
MYPIIICRKTVKKPVES